MLDAFNDLLPVTKNLDLAVAYFYFSGLRLVEGPITNLVETRGHNSPFDGQQNQLHDGRGC